MNWLQTIIERAAGYPIAWDDTAAWAQAFGAIVAIVVTYIIAHRESRERKQRERMEDRRQAEAQRALAHSAFIIISEAHRITQEAATFRGAFDPRPTDTQTFAEVARAMADFPVHTITHPRVMEMLVVARSTLAEVRSALRSPLVGGDAHLGEYSRRLSDCATAVLGLLPTLGTSEDWRNKSPGRGPLEGGAG